MTKHIFILITACAVAFSSRSQTIFYTQNFEGVTTPSLPAGWVEAHAGGGHGWESHLGPVRMGMYDIPAHTKYCMVNDAAYYWNDIAQLTTSSFSLVGSSNPHLSFDYMYGEWLAVEKAWVEISTNGGATFTTIDTIRTIGTWMTKFVDLSGVTPSANCKLKFCYQSPTGSGFAWAKGLFGIAIDNIMVYSPTSVDIGMVGAIPQAGIIESYAKVGDSVTFSGWIANFGTTGVPSFTIWYQAGTAAPVSQYFSSSTLPFNWNGFTAFSIPYIASAASTQTIKIWVQVPGDTNPLNDTVSTIITAMNAASMPKKRPFVEELTGTWCGWCPRGIIYMDSLWRSDSASNSITCVHSKFNYDNMANDNLSTRLYDTLTNRINALGYPSAILDRNRRIQVSNYLFYEIYKEKRLFGFAHIGVTHNTSSGSLQARATIKPTIDLSGDYRLELIVTEEDVTGTGWQFAQANAYSGSATPMYGCGYNFNDSAGIIPASSMKYRFVARYTLPENIYKEPNGVAGSLPSVMHADSFYSYNFAPVAIPSNWKPEKLRCIVVLIDNTPTSPNYNLVLNSATTSHPPLIGPTTHVDEAFATNVNMQLYPNPARESVTVSFTLHESNVTDVCIYNMQGRLLYVAPAQQAAGTQKLAIPINDLPTGVYTITLRSGALRTSKLLTVTR